MTEFKAAGHTFVDTPNGVRCQVCNASWLFVRSATEMDLGTVGFAHIGKLLPLEYAEIATKREVEEDFIWQAVCGGAEGTPW